jgi:8-oxo-dGTP diphosphatase
MIELILLIASIIILYIVFPIVGTYTLIKTFIKWDLRILKIWFYRTAVAIDQMGNTIGAPLFNDMLIITGGYKFGNTNETISSVIGKNYRDNTLSRSGKLLRRMLDFIDANHSLKSISEDEHNTRK